MAHVQTLPQTRPVHLPLGEVLPWAVLAHLFPGLYIHEFLHDGRHLLGFPCH